MASWSWIANLPDQERITILGRVRELAGRHASVTLRYRTEMWWTGKCVVPI